MYLDSIKLRVTSFEHLDGDLDHKQSLAHHGSNAFCCEFGTVQPLESQAANGKLNQGSMVAEHDMRFTVLVARVAAILDIFFLVINLLTVVNWLATSLVKSDDFVKTVLEKARNIDRNGLGFPVAELLVKALLLRGRWGTQGCPGRGGDRKDGRITGGAPGKMDFNQQDFMGFNQVQCHLLGFN
eukprot:s1305_g11.t1